MLKRTFVVLSFIAILLTTLTACGGVPMPQLPKLPSAPAVTAPECSVAEPKLNCVDANENQKVVVKYHPVQNGNTYWDQEWSVTFWLVPNAMGNGVSWDLYSNPDQKVALKHGQSNDYLKAFGTWSSVTFKVIDKGDKTGLRVVWPAGTLITSVTPQ